MEITHSKIRICKMCGVEMLVPKTSGKKHCAGCLLEHNRVKAREWYSGNIKECRVRASKKVTEKNKNNPKHRLWSRARAQAAARGLEFNLTVDDIEIPEVCPVLGVPFVYNTYYTMSLDRVDNSKGYIKGNVQVLSFKANAMKNSATDEELVKFARWVLTKVVREPNVYEVGKAEVEFEF